jgi:uncharacterized protein
MKRIFSFVIVLILLISVTSCTKTKTELFENGRVKSQIQYRFGKENGISRYFHPVYGSKIMEVNMKNGKKEGELSKFYFNGNREYQGFYKNDLLEGIERIWDKSGQILSETHYIKGKKEGSYNSWYENGVNFAKGSYKNDLPHGKWEFYDQRGMLIGDSDYNLGTGIQTHYDYNGIISIKTTFKNGLKNGPEIHYNPDGTVLSTTIYQNDRIIEVDGKPVNK